SSRQCRRESDRRRLRCRLQADPGLPGQPSARPAGCAWIEGCRMSFVEFTGTARLGRRTKNLVRRLGPGDVAIIDHQDLDRASAENTLRYLRGEGRLLSEGLSFPPLRTRFRERHSLVVARGPGYKRDLAIVRPYVRDFKPVVVGVDGGADALLDAGMRPDVIV